MYGYRAEAESRRSVRERLNGNAVSSTGQRRVTGKRQRGDDKGEHDLFEEEAPRVSSCKFDGRDLCSKLQRKRLQPAFQCGRTSTSGVRDLRENLSGTMSKQPLNADPPRSKAEVAGKRNKKTCIESLKNVTKKANKIPKSKVEQKDGTTVDVFLQSMGLEKYHVTFQAEEVDMTVLIHLTDDDLKALGIPMGPRKKILLALETRKA